jgi:hypothetical protein
MRRVGALFSLLLLFMLSIVVTTGAVGAQGNTITYGGSIIGSVFGEDIVRTTFEGSAGDVISARVLSTTGVLNPMLTLESPSGEVLISVENDQFSPQPLDAAFSILLEESGTYTLIVVAEDGTEGEYLLQLNGRPQADNAPLSLGQTVTINLDRASTVQYFLFVADASCPTTLTVTNLTVGFPFGFPFAIKLRNLAGGQVATALGGRQLEDRFSVEAGSGIYEIELSSVNPLSDGQVRLAVTCADDQPTCELPDLPPLVLPTATPTPTPDTSSGIAIQDGGFLNYNAAAIGFIGENSPLVQYTFAGLEGDLVSIQVIGISTDFDPQFTLITPEGGQERFSDNDFFSFNGTDAAVNLFLPATGNYSILVGGEGGAGGSFVVRVLARLPSVAQGITFGQVLPVDVPFETDIPTPTPTPPPFGEPLPNNPNPPQIFRFTASDECPVAIVVDNNISPGEPFTFPFVLTLRDLEGTVVGQVRGGNNVEARLIVAPRSGTYEAEITRINGRVEGTIELLSLCAGDAPMCELWREPTPAPVIVRPRNTDTPTPTETPIPTFTAFPFIPSDTPIPPTATETLVPTLTPTFTETPTATPTVTATIEPSATYTDFPTSTPAITNTPDPCGNGTCERGEGCFDGEQSSGVQTSGESEPFQCPNPNYCEADCACGNSVCEPGLGENIETCEQDCAFCGDGVCSPSRGEDTFSCSNDCIPQCDNGICENGEDDYTTQFFCPNDCIL